MYTNINGNSWEFQLKNLSLQKFKLTEIYEANSSR